MGRYCERYLGRSYERFILDWYARREGEKSSLLSYIKMQWYFWTPSCLQLSLTPQWIPLSDNVMKSYTISERNKRRSSKYVNLQTTFFYGACLSLNFNFLIRFVSYAETLHTRKQANMKRFMKGCLFIISAVVSYASSAPSFYLNLISIFFTSVALV